MKRREKPQNAEKTTFWDIYFTAEKRQEYREWLYAFCYTVGVRTVRCLRSLSRFTRWLWRPIERGVKRLVDVVFVQNARRFKNELRRLGEGFSLAWQTLHEEHAFRNALKIPVLAVRRHRKVATSILNVAAPLLAVLVLLFTVGYWRGAEFALFLTYNDTEVGYIADESTFVNASTLVKQSVINADGGFVINKHPQMQIAVIHDQSLLQEEEVRDRIFETLGEQVQPAAGLYVDGVFKGALPSAASIKSKMDTVLDVHRSKEYDGVGFFCEVEIKEGTYPTSALIGEADMLSVIRRLPVKTVKNVTTVEKLKYKTVYQPDATQPLGYEELITKGKDGKQRVLSQIIYVDGKEQYRTVVATDVIQKAVDRVMKIGAQTYGDTSIIGDGVATDSFIWPLPYTKTISSPFASRWGSFHGAIDIANGSTMGKPIIASDGGTVVEAEYHGSYGYYVLIDHGNGFMTRYAHCSKLVVEAGEKVAQGQYIAKVGNTGYSLGAHLHFEIIKDGVLVDPLDYVQR
ncbi:MAG: peptidoglycan DD-metalloendopeptidase family protein [Clostridia bacterium]|nr:peptidoglycan DD-metalloendopeptidase family protein [Clostridia bacterium]